jgi:endonuclease YncB( thermonuclease family)
MKVGCRRIVLSFVVAAAVCLDLCQGVAHAEPVQLADGDSFSLGRSRYRLYGIDAPELHQTCTDPSGRDWPCGLRARSELRRLIGTYPVECKSVAVDRFGRNVATCIAGGRDLAEEMVRAGFATASVRPGFSGPYEHAEQEARAGQRGIWAGSFDMPRDWRRDNPRDENGRDQLPRPRDWLWQTIAEAKETLARWLDAVWPD